MYSKAKSDTNSDLQLSTQMNSMIFSVRVQAVPVIPCLCVLGDSGLILCHEPQLFSQLWVMTWSLTIVVLFRGYANLKLIGFTITCPKLLTHFWTILKY